MSGSYQVGKNGEDLALEYYLEKGYTLIIKNFQYYREGLRGRLGEIDLIFEKNKKLYLVEVKTRTDSSFGTPQEQVTKAKLTYLYKTWQYFLLKNPKFQNYFCQFDLVSILNNQLEVIQNSYNFDSLSG